MAICRRGAKASHVSSLCRPLRVLGFVALVGSIAPNGAGIAGESDTLRIGLLLPPEEPQARAVREGASLAAEEASPPGAPRPEILVRGRVGQWGADGVEAARMVTDDGVQGVIAPPDGAASHLTLQISGRTAVPVVTLCSDASVGRTGVPWLLRIVPETFAEAKALFTGLSSGQSGPTNRWVAVVPEGRLGREISSDLRQAAQAVQVNLEKTLEFSVPSTNADELVAQVLRSRPTGVLLWLAPLPAAKFAGSLRAAGYQGTLAGPGRLQTPDFIEAADRALDGLIIPVIAQNADTKTRRQSFEASYHRRWGHQPGTMAALSYDATMLLAHLLRQPEFRVPPHRLAAAFSWPGVTGDLRFDANGNRQATLELWQGRQGRFVPLSKSDHE